MSDPVSQNKVSSEEHLRLSSSLNIYVHICAIYIFTKQLKANYNNSVYMDVGLKKDFDVILSLSFCLAVISIPKKMNMLGKNYF